jgi:transcriptional regulator with XRE-family HTH domain
MLNYSGIECQDKISVPAAAMIPEQCRAARGWLGWSQLKLARQANVSLRAIAAFERGEQKPRPNNLIAIRRAIEGGGIRLLFDKNGAAAGILRRGSDPDLSSDAHSY